MALNKNNNDDDEKNDKNKQTHAFATYCGN